jgi:uncharacterized BrkB/YihY/UPF0761 family membrane protein
VLVAGGTVARAVEVVYRVDTTWFVALRWPLGALLVLGSLTVLFSRAPRRRQPGWSWLALGAGMSLVLWLGLNALLVLYVRHSEAFGTTYGPLTGVVALLAWANLTSIALYLGIAFAAQLEAVRAGVRTGAAVDPELDRVGEHGDAAGAAPPFTGTAVGRRLA